MYTFFSFQKFIDDMLDRSSKLVVMVEELVDLELAAASEEEDVQVYSYQC